MARSEFTTPIGRLMFPHLFKPEVPTNQSGQPTGGEPRYTCVLVFDKKAQATEAYKKLAAAVSDEAKDYFKGSVPKTARNPLIKVGDTDYAEKYEGFNDDDVMIRPWSKFQPGIVDGRLNDITIESDVWAGQLFRATVTPAGYDTSGNKGVLLFLNNLQQAKADEPRMDGRKSAASSFEATEEGEAETADADAFFG